MSDAPQVSVVISTRDRGDCVVDTVRDVLSNDYPRFEIRVVDQSEDDLTEISLRPLSRDSRVHYSRTSAKGLSAGLNLGIENAEGEIIAITGDDCEVPTNWLEELVAAFGDDQATGIVFGNVLPGPHDHERGFVPGYVRTTADEARCLREKDRVGGTSACMGLRRTAWRALSGFDPLLGVGSRFHSAEDADLTLRALARGYRVYETPRVCVVHHGFYSWDRHRTLVHRYWYGSGMAYTKQLKCRQWSIGIVLLRLARDWIFSRSRVAGSFGLRPYRLRGGIAFVLGSLRAILTPVDRSAGHYVRRGGLPLDASGAHSRT